MLTEQMENKEQKYSNIVEAVTKATGRVILIDKDKQKIEKVVEAVPGVLLNIQIYPLSDGSFILKIECLRTTDGLTYKIFKKRTYSADKEYEEYLIRELENGVYELPKDGEDYEEELSYEYEKCFNTYEEVFKHLEEVLKKVVEIRKYLRDKIKDKNDKFFVVL